MAMDENFILFLIPALLALAVAVLVLPSRRRIERDPSTAFKRGRRTLVNLAVLLSLVLGLILLVYGQTQNAKEVLAGVNMVQIGGISLMAMGATLIAASVVVRSQVRRAGRGHQEEVFEVDAMGGRPGTQGARGPPAERTGSDLPPRPYPPPPRRVGRGGPLEDAYGAPPPRVPLPKRGPPEH